MEITLPAILTGLGLIFTVLATGFNAAMFAVIKFNDLKHLEQNVTEIKTTVNGLSAKIDNSLQRVSTLEGTVFCKVSKRKKVVRK